MAVTLPDIKRTISYRRANGTRAEVPYLTPYLVLGDEVDKLAPAVRKGMALFAKYTGRPRSAFDTRAQEDVLRPLCGDYRIARCLIAALLTYYEYRSPVFADLLPADIVALLEQHELASPWQLRLAFYEYLNRAGAGFVHTGKREAALLGFIAGLPDPRLQALTPSMVEELLYLDAEERSVLVRSADTPEPEPAAIIRRLNAMILHTLLFTASQIVLTLYRPDGALVKHIYTLCKLNYLLCDIERPAMLAEMRVPGEENAWINAPLTIVISGPDDVFGPATRWGDRLARAGMQLIKLLAGHQAEQYEYYASIHLNKRPYRLAVDAAIVDALGDSTPGSSFFERSAGDYDSGVEESFAREFDALYLQGQTAGWELEREPVPVVIETRTGHGVFIPDFAFARAGSYVFLEIIGFWTSAYKEKKRRKLEQLRGRLNLILAVSADAAVDFSGLGFPLLSYSDFPTVTETVAILNREFGGWEQRSAALPAKAEKLLSLAQQQGIVDEAALMRELECYTRSELRQALPLLTQQPLASVAEKRAHYTSDKRVSQAEVRFVEGLGLVRDDLLERAAALLDEILTTEAVPAATVPAPLPAQKNRKRAAYITPPATESNRASLDSVLARFKTEIAEFADLKHPDALLEALDARVVRDSLFDAYVTKIH